MKRLMVLAGVSAILYALNRIVFIPTFPDIQFFRRYVGDLLALPVYLPLSIYLAWRLKLIPDSFQISAVQVLGGVIIFSLLFEGLIPIIDKTSIRDGYDILAYLAGSLLVFVVSSTGQDRISQTSNQE